MLHQKTSSELNYQLHFSRRIFYQNNLLAYSTRFVCYVIVKEKSSCYVISKLKSLKMQRKRIINVGVALVSVSLGAYYSKEIRDASIGALRFGRTAVAVGTKIIFKFSHLISFILCNSKVGEILVDYNRSLYSKTIDVGSAEYPKLRSEVKFNMSKKMKWMLLKDKQLI